MEVGVDGQLFDLLSKQPLVKEESVSIIARNLLEAVDYLHNHNIIHRDIKPENVVLIHVNILICRAVPNYAISGSLIFATKVKEN